MPLQLRNGEASVAVPEADHASVLKIDGVLHEEVYGEVFEVEDDADTFTLAVDRRGFPPVDVAPELTLKAKAEISLDGGQTWNLLCAFTTKNGPIYAPRIELGRVVGRGEEVFESSGYVPLPPGKGRLVRTQIVPIKDVRTSLVCSALRLARDPVAVAVERAL